MTKKALLASFAAGALLARCNAPTSEQTTTVEDALTSAQIASVRVDVTQGRTLIATQTIARTARAIFVVPAASYDLTATPLDSRGAILTACSVARGASAPAAGAPASQSLTIACNDRSTLAVDTILSVEPAPVITSVDVELAGDPITDQHVSLRALTNIPAGMLTMRWTIDSAPPRAVAELDGNGNLGVFSTATEGDYTVSVSATSPIGVAVSRTPLHVRPRRPLEGHLTERPCRDGDERLEDFSARCDKAMGGVGVQAFDCDDQDATEPPRQEQDGSGNCGAPNVLNHMCDPGSRFHVLHRNENNDGVYIVAHCRKIGNATGKYSDVAVIQYNANSGATCYYQALGTLSHNAPAPISGDTSYWKTPAGTAGINCVRCHDTGPFIRSPYLAQLGEVWPYIGDENNPHNSSAPNLPPPDDNYLPGTLMNDFAGTWNSSMPYSFVGLNFQSWEAYSLSNSSDATCLGCHRMGISRTEGAWNNGQGTAERLGIIATDTSQTAKVGHGVDDPGNSSPIWMTPGQIDYSGSTKTHADAISNCGLSFTDPNAAGINGCSMTRFARGNTCPPPPTVINGSTQADDPHTWVGGGKTPLGQPGGKAGFFYFTALHGPFYQNSAWDPYMNEPQAVADPAWDPQNAAPSFRGSYLRIYGEPAGQWMSIWGIDATDIQNNGGVPPGGPGGEIAGINFESIDSIIDPDNCGSGYRVVRDETGNNSPLSAIVDSTQGQNVAILAGFIGNVARRGIGTVAAPPQATLRLQDTGGQTVLTQVHENNPNPAFNEWFTGESWANGCSTWQASMHYAAHGVQSTNDVLLVPTADVPNVICYIDGIGGDWSKWRSDGNGGSLQPYAQIYIDESSGYRLKVWPTSGADAVRAYATCLYLSN